jgi:hypothetical protein
MSIGSKCLALALSASTLADSSAAPTARKAHLPALPRPSMAEFSTSPTDAAQAFVNRIVFPSHLLQRFQRRCVAGRLGLAFRDERSGLTLITGLPIGLGLDEPALLNRRESGSSADHEAEHHGYKQIQRPIPSPCRLFNLPCWMSA